MRNNRVGRWSVAGLLASTFYLAGSGVVLAMPQLTGWRFDSQAQRLSLFTDGAVQPRVQIVENPRRVVVDLPGTDLAAPANQPVPSGPVRIVRAGQFDPQTARMVIEMADGAPALQPAQVRLRRVGPLSSGWCSCCRTCHRRPCPRVRPRLCRLSIRPRSHRCRGRRPAASR